MHVRVRARIGQRFEVELRTADGTARAAASGFVVEPDRTRAVSESDLVEHVGRMGASPFEPDLFEVELDDGCGMGFSAVHRVRATACEALERELLLPYARRSLTHAPSREAICRELGTGLVGPVRPSDVEVCAVVSSAAAARAARRAGAVRVYAAAGLLGEGEWPDWVIPSLDEVCRESDHERLDAWVQGGEPLAVGNVSELVLARERGALPEVRGCIPVHNSSCVKALEAAGARGIWLSPELSLKEIEEIAPYSSVPLGLTVYGHARAMTCEHCVLQVADACCGDCGRCSLRRRKTFLRGGEGELYPVQTDAEGRSRVYASWLLDATSLIPRLAEAGLKRFAVDCTLLSAKEAAEALRLATRAVESWQDGMGSRRRGEGRELGHLFSPVS